MEGRTVTRITCGHYSYTYHDLKIQHYSNIEDVFIVCRICGENATLDKFLMIVSQELIAVKRDREFFLSVIEDRFNEITMARVLDNTARKQEENGLKNKS